MILEADISPVDSIVIIRSAEKLDLFKSGGARKGAGDGRMQAQEGMEGRRTCSGNSFITKSAAHRLEEEEEDEEQEMAVYLFSVALRSGTWAAGRRFSLLTRYLCVSCHDRDSKKKKRSFLFLVPTPMNVCMCMDLCVWFRSNSTTVLLYCC